MEGYFEIAYPDDTYCVHNLTVDTGKNILLRLLAGEDVGLDTIRIGTGTNPVTHGQTGLAVELVSKKITNTIIGVDLIVFEAVLSYNEGNALITEMGVFAKDGTMYARALTVPRTKTSSEAITIRYKVGLRGEEL